MYRMFWMTWKCRAFQVMVILLGVAPFGVFAEGDAEEEGKAEQAVAPAGQFPIVAEKITISAYLPSESWVDDYQENDFVYYIEEKTNIHLDLYTVPISEAQQKRNLLLAAGDYPEVFIDGSGSKVEQKLYGEQGVFLPLNDLIDEYGVNTRKAFADYPLVKANLTLADGTVYALPRINDCFHCSFSQKMWIYQPWLDKLGLEMPSTPREFRDVLIAFRDGDPNGNGLKDEIPLSGDKNGWNAQIDGFLMNPFVYTGGQISGEVMGRVYAENGRVKAAFALPGWKEGLIYLNELFSEGLMHSEVFTQDLEQYRQLGENPGPVILGAGPGGAVNMAFFNGESGRWLEYKAVPPLEGPGGDRFAYYYPDFGYGAWTITDKAKNPEAAFRLGDAFMDFDVMMRKVWGRKGIEWDEPGPGEMGINGLPAVWKRLLGEGEMSPTSRWGTQGGPMALSREIRLGSVAQEGASVEGILFEETRSKMEPYRPDLASIVPILTYDEDIAAEMVDLTAALATYVSEMTARFTIGDVDIQDGWDDYLAELENIGLSRYLALVQEAYDNR